MSGINKVFIIGNLGQDPDVRYMTNGNAVANFSVATSETWKDRNTGQKKEETEWHTCVCFGRQAEIAAEYLRKGSKVFVEGKIKTEKWQDREGNTRYATKIHVRGFQMLDARRSASPDPQPTPQQSDFDDDIPF